MNAVSRHLIYENDDETKEMAQSLFVLIVVCWKRGLLRKVRFILRRGLRQAGCFKGPGPEQKLIFR